MCDKSICEYKFQPVERYVAPAPVPYILSEENLPRDHKVLVFLPHSDDGRYFGSSLYLMNKTNDVKIIVMSTGYHGVDEDLSKSKKIEKRWGETRCWAEMLGFKPSQLIDFRADNTYEKQKIDNTDMQKLHWLLEYEKPTMIFVPHMADTAQPINFNTRAMVVACTFNRLRDKHKENHSTKSILVVEYPTNHVPIIPPSDKNCIVVFSDNGLAEIKHEANKAHESQVASGFDITERFVEAVEAVTEADSISHFCKQRRKIHALSGVEVDPMKSRGEQFSITKVHVKSDKTPIIIEERLKFPLCKRDDKLWNNK